MLLENLNIQHWILFCFLLHKIQCPWCVFYSIIVSFIINTSKYYHWVKSCLFHLTTHIASEGATARKARFIHYIWSLQVLKTLEIWKLSVPKDWPYFQIMEICMYQCRLVVLIYLDTYKYLLQIHTLLTKRKLFCFKNEEKNRPV